MKLPLYWIDAFTDKTFHGNPAAVVPLDQWLPEATMQRIAFENGLAETAFFVKTGLPSNLSAKASATAEALANEKHLGSRYHLRWFTPAIEVELCGHATLATAFALFTQLNLPGNLVTFDSKSGPLTVTRQAGCRLELDFPARPAEPAAPPELLVRALGRAPEFVTRTRTNWLCVYPRAADVLALQPDHSLLRQVTPGRMIVTAPGDDCDFVSRFFAPDAGIPEDPVTGGSHTTLIPYWAQRLGKDQLHARQVSTRGGELWCELRGDRVAIAGHAVLYLRGEIEI
jgi:PhzF family phenazine biosynthesis protein